MLCKNNALIQTLTPPFNVKVADIEKDIFLLRTLESSCIAECLVARCTNDPTWYKAASYGFCLNC